jgi:hypothetical protein
MTWRQRCLQFSLRSVLFAMLITGISIQVYRYAVYVRKVQAERAALEVKIESVIARNHHRAPLCGVLFLGQLSRDLDKSPVYQNMPARERSRLGSRIEAERARHYDRGDAAAVFHKKGQAFVKVEDRYVKP